MDNPCLPQGVGIPHLIPHASAECVDLVVQLLKYDAAERITSRVGILSFVLCCVLCRAVWCGVVLCCAVMPHYRCILLFFAVLFFSIACAIPLYSAVWCDVM